MAWVPLAFLLIAAVCDLRTREVPDWIALALLLWALLATAFGWHGVDWLSLGIGLAEGLAAALILFYLLRLGGGDAKLVIALGAALGHPEFLRLLFWVALAGGFLSLVALLRRKRDLAYVPAIALGMFAYLVLLELRHAGII